MENNKPTYLDFAATTPVDRRVVNSMMPYFSEAYGNPSSYHKYGQGAENALENARDKIAKIFRCLPSEVIFTSCGTESDNLALRGAALMARRMNGANHILISPVEHHAVSHTAQQLSQVFGFKLEYLPVDQFGIVHAEDVARHIRDDTAVVSVIYANNEIGTINPISEIGNVCLSRGVLFHTDAVQAAGYHSLDTTTLNADLISIGAHKFYGPKGVGALYVRQGTSLIPSQTGGGQEYGLRAGTQNVPYIVGMAEALHLAQIEKEDRINSIRPLRDHLIGTILEEIPDVQLTGHPEHRLPNHASFVFRGVDGNTLLMMLDVEGYACSSGSACKTGNPEPSEVLTNLRFSPEWALGSLRVTLGTSTSASEIDAFLNILPKVISKLRKIRSK